MENMDWDKAIKECPSNKDGKCTVVFGEKPCEDNVSNGKCPIKQLQNKEDK